MQVKIKSATHTSIGLRVVFTEPIFRSGKFVSWGNHAMRVLRLKFDGGHYIDSDTLTLHGNRQANFCTTAHVQAFLDKYKNHKLKLSLTIDPHKQVLREDLDYVQPAIYVWGDLPLTRDDAQSLRGIKGADVQGPFGTDYVSRANSKYVKFGGLALNCGFTKEVLIDDRKTALKRIANEVKKILK